MTDTKIAGLDPNTAGDLSLVLTFAVILGMEYVQPTVAAAGYQIPGLVVHTLVALLALGIAVARLRS